MREAGFRFIKRGARYMWAHPATLQPGDMDCTDMDDATFELFVRIGELLK